VDIVAGTLISPAGSLLGNEGTKPEKSEGIEIPFKDFLTQAIQDVNNLQKEAEQKIGEMALGNANSFHEIIIATEKASLALQLITQIQNKLVDAYHEIMRIQL